MDLPLKARLIWFSLALVTILQLVAIGTAIVITLWFRHLPPARLDWATDLINNLLVFTPTIHAAVATAMIFKSRSRGEPISRTAYWICSQGVLLALVLWVLIIYTVIYYC